MSDVLTDAERHVNGHKPANPTKVGSGSTRPRTASSFALEDDFTASLPERWRGRLIDVDKLLDAPVEPVVYRIDQLARDGFHTIVSGAAGLHKTNLVMAMHHGVVTGTGIGEMQCRGGPTIHFDAELGEVAYKDRSHTSGYGRGVNLVNAVGLDLSRQDDQDHMAEVIAHFAGDDGGLATYDSLRALTPGATENDSDAMVPVVRGITNIARETGVAIVGIHHSGWDGKRMRGSSGILDQCDAMFSWRAADGDGGLVESEDDAGYERWLMCRPGVSGQKYNIGRAPKTRRFVFDERTCRIMGVDEVELRQVESWETRILRVVAAGKVTRNSRRAAADALECSHTTAGFTKAWNDMCAKQVVVWNADAGHYELGEGVEVPSDPYADSQVAI